MKKIVLTLGSVALLFAAKTNAQSNISIGPVVSIGASRLTNTAPSSDFIFSGALGVGLVYSSSAHLGFGFQALVSREGYGDDGVISGGTITYRDHPLYLRLPLTVNYFFGKFGDKIRPKIYAGPVVGIKLSEKTNYTTNVAGVETNYSNKTEIFKSFDLGLKAGGGFNIRIARTTWLNLDAAYYQSVINAVKTNQNINYRNQNILFNVGVMFGI